MRRYRKRLYDMAALFAFLAITACGGMQERPEPIIRTVEVQVPVTVPCEAAAAVGVAPDYPDTDAALLAGADLRVRVALLLAGRLLRMDREATLQRAIEDCR